MTRTSTPLALLLVLASLPLAACGAKQSGDAVKVQTGLLACTYSDIAKDDAAPYVEGSPETPGQPTPELAQARMKYDAGQHAEAIPLLEKVVSGESGDDEGNRQLAEYWLGAAEFQIGRYDKSVAAFAPIAHRPSHLKRRDTAPWLGRLMNQPISSTQAIDLLGLYRHEELATFDVDPTRPLFRLLQYGRGRALYRKADFHGALEAFDRIAHDPTLEKIVGGCVAFATAGMRPR